MIRKWHVALLVLPLMLAAACGSDDPASPPPATSGAAVGSAVPAPAVALNPVDLIVKAGGVPPPGATVGQLDANGNHYAEGTIGADMNGASESITVYVWASPGSAWPEKPSDDGHWYIRGDGFEAGLTGIISSQSDGIVFPVSPEEVVAKIGGKVIPRG